MNAARMNLASPQASPAAVPAFLLPQRGRMRVPVQVFGSERLPASPEEIAGLEQVASLEDVAQVVALPDLHVKPQLETPSSTATATHQTVILDLSSPSPGCGMALARTPLGEADLDPARLDRWMAFLSRRLPVDPATRSPLIDDVRPLFLGGAAAAAHHLGLDPQVVGAIERSGNALQAGDFDLDESEILETLPEALFPLARREFGTIGRGNHFLELQVVEAVLDETIAAQWGLQPGQVVVMYHADSGRLGAMTGRLYAHRLKNNWRGRWLELQVKGGFHLRQALQGPAPLTEMVRRGRTYFWPQRHTPLPAGSMFARQALVALAAATNYAFANRLAILAAVQAGLEEVWGQAGAGADLLYDVTHNSIQREAVGAERLWVHRHNASRALPAGHPDLSGGPFALTGQPLLLPGTNRTHSYLAAARPGTSASLYSVDHGAGRSAERLQSPRLQGTGEAEPHRTRLYSLRSGFAGERAHISSAGVDEVLDILGRADLASPVVRLRPLAALKDRPA